MAAVRNLVPQRAGMTTRRLFFHLFVSILGLVGSLFGMYNTLKIVRLGGDRYAWEFDLAVLQAWAFVILIWTWIDRIRESKMVDTEAKIAANGKETNPNAERTTSWARHRV
jgi:hypothetical protein